MKEVILVPNSKIRKLDQAYILWGHDYKFINELISDGFRVKVIAQIETVLAYEGGIETKESMPLTFIDIKLSESRYNLWNYISTYFRSSVALFRMLAKKPGFVYIYYPSRIGLIAGILSKIFRVEYGIYLRGRWNLGLLNKMASNLLFRCSNFIITTGMEFSEQVSLIQKNVQPVVPMINIDGFGEGATDVVRREKMAPFTVLYVGRILKEKGVMDSILAIDELVDQKVDVRLLIAGMGSDDEINALKDSVNKMDLSKSVTFLGHIGDREKLAKLYCTSDLFVFPSYYPEGFPRVIYEAMLNRLPVVCTLLPGMKGFMKPDTNCIEVKPRCPNQLSEVILRLSKDEKNLRSIADQAFEDVHRYLASFSHSSHAKQVIDNVNASENRAV